MTLISLRYTSRRYDRRQSRSEENTPLDALPVLRELYKRGKQNMMIDDQVSINQVYIRLQRLPARSA